LSLIGAPFANSILQLPPAIHAPDLILSMAGSATICDTTCLLSFSWGLGGVGGLVVLCPSQALKTISNTAEYTYLVFIRQPFAIFHARRFDDLEGKMCNEGDYADSQKTAGEKIPQSPTK